VVRYRVSNAFFVVCLLLLGTRAFATDFVVSKTTDSADGTCNADCSLREAIIAANANVGPDRIILASGLTYTLTLGPADAPGAIVPLSGDLDITDALTIEGNGSTIDAGLLDRVLDIQGSFLVTINNLTIKNGRAGGFLSLGGGISIRNASVVLNNCIITSNNTAVESGARDAGGGIAVVGSFNAGTGIATLASLTLNSSTVSGNNGLNGGGVLCVLCSLTVNSSTISGNTASGMDGGGIDAVGNASSLSMTGSTLSGNSVIGGSSRGGGLSVPFGVSVSTLGRNRIVSNTASLGAAIFESAGTVAATNNWWGCSFGPGTVGPGCSAAPNGTAGTVTSSPFLILIATASPPGIVPAGSSMVTADLRFNSASMDTSGTGTVPNGIVAAFSGALGTFATPTATTTGGKANDLFTSNGTIGLSTVGVNVDGQTASTALTISPLTVTTNPASGIGLTGATLNGTIVPNGLDAVGQFQYGLTAAYGNTTPAQSLGAGSVPIPIVAAVAGLTCNTPYHYRAIASNSVGTSAGSDVTFTTSACTMPPTTVTGAASGITRTHATLSGTANPNGAATTASFEYGKTTAYGSTTPGQSLGAGFSVLSIGGGSLTGLACGTVYHFRATAINADGTTPGSDATFKTAACTVGDFDGDGSSDLDLYRPSTGTWYVSKSNTNYASAIVQPWGVNTDVPVAGDFDGDGKADPAVYRPSTGTWYILESSTNFTTYITQAWGIGSDIPVPGDYDGDGKTDLGVFRPSTETWYILLSGSNYTTYIQQTWGLGTDIMVPGDFDGDGKTDLGVFRPATGTWYILLSGSNYTTYIQQAWGLDSDITVPGDYDGDGKTDFGVYRPSTGAWYVLTSSSNYTAYIAQTWGVSTDIPVPGDYDGDGKTDFGVYRPSTGAWYVLTSSSNYTSYIGVMFGTATDTPVLHRP
jgi:CSLREA domain-containing protein